MSNDSFILGNWGVSNTFFNNAVIPPHLHTIRGLKNTEMQKHVQQNLSTVNSVVLNADNKQFAEPV